MATKRADPVLKEAAPFPFALGAAVTVEYEGSPWKAKVHRVAVNQTTCTVKYELDGSMEGSVSPSRINRTQLLPSLEPIAEVPSDVQVAEGVASSVEADPEPEPIEPTKPPLVDPVFRKKRSISQLNRFFDKLMKARMKRLKHKAKFCCGLRHDMPYFSAAVGEDGTLSLKFVHGTVEMTNGCNLSHCDSIRTVDSYLYLKGELLVEAHRLSDLE